MNEIIHWVQLGVFYLAGSLAETPPSTATSYSETFATQSECEIKLIDLRLLGNAIATKVKTSSVLVGGHYEQLVVTKPVNLVDFGEGFGHFSCIPFRVPQK